MCWWGPRSADRHFDAIICDGAVRSGKTLCMGLSFVCWAMASFRGAQFAFCGKSVVSLRRNLLQELTPTLEELGFRCRERRSENLVIIGRSGRENRFYLMGGKDEGSAAFIQGVTLAGVLLDEAALMPRSFVEQAIARCSVQGSRLWFNCNPEGPQHWFYQEWILKRETRNALYLHFTMEDNPSLSARIRQRYRSSYSGAFYRRFILGEWTAAKGLVYDFFDPARDAVPRPGGKMEQYVISVDYGTANPCSFGLWGLREGVWYRMEEYYYASRKTGVQLTDQEYVRALQALADGREIRSVVADPSAASFITALRQAGFHVVKANNDVLSGIRITADLLKRGRIAICEGCEDCLREIAMYRWSEETEGRDAPHKDNDHAMDDMRYFAVTVAAGERREEGAFCSVVRRS
ncbi:MAG: PBSX family phage terminase large subunit [Oscillospiraceae bacterium]|nr:PBSX family phage terminase large subunit [Oscillospiraceae bacterium]